LQRWGFKILKKLKPTSVYCICLVPAVLLWKLAF
jgi:hypothetical protein